MDLNTKLEVFTIKKMSAFVFKIDVNGINIKRTLTM